MLYNDTRKYDTPKPPTMSTPVRHLMLKMAFPFLAS